VRTRLLTALAALVLAIVGGFLVSAYVQGADQRALAGAKTVEILVVNEPVPAGTPTEQLAQYLTVKALPASVVAAGALSDLSTVGGKVTAVDLVPTEQLLESRLVAADERTIDGAVPVPEGLQEVTVPLAPDRVLGGTIRAGDTVGIFVTMVQNERDTTHLLFHKVLVTNVQGAPALPAEGTDALTAPVPTAPMYITFARNSADAEKIVFATQYGSIWLSREPEGADETGTRMVTRDGFFQ
jgi:pilus assembly protein CpaB